MALSMLQNVLDVQKLTQPGSNRVLERDFRITNLLSLRLIKVLYLRKESCLQNTHLYKHKGPCLKRPLTWTQLTGSTFPLLMFVFPVSSKFLESTNLLK